MSQEWIIYLVIALIFLILVLVGVVLYLGLKIIKSQGAVFSEAPSVTHKTRLEELTASPPLEISKTSKMSDKMPEVKIENSKHYCINHPSDHAMGVCAICQNSYCEECIKEHEGHSFCEAHFRLFVSHEWQEIDTIQTNPDIPESALPLYDFKQTLWQEKEIPSVLSTHYKINIEGDFIESYVKLVVRKEELAELKDRYDKLKQ